MAVHQTSAILHSIEEELAKLALEVDVMESKILRRSISNVNEEEDADFDDADTVVSLSESECGSMGSFEEFVHCSLPPVNPSNTDKKCIPFSLDGSRKSTGKSFTQIPRLNKSALSPLSKKSSWRIGVEDFHSFGSSSKSDDTTGTGKYLKQDKGNPKAPSIEVPKIMQRILAKSSKLPKPPRSIRMEHEPTTNIQLLCTLGTSQLPKPPAARGEVHVQ